MSDNAQSFLYTVLWYCVRVLNWEKSNDLPQNLLTPQSREKYFILLLLLCCCCQLLFVFIFSVILSVIFCWKVSLCIYVHISYLILSPLSSLSSSPSRLSSDTYVAMLMNDEVHTYDDVRKRERREERE